MKVNKTSIIFILFTFCIAITSLTFSINTIHSQTQKPLTLAQVLTGLQARSGGFTLAQKNSFITKRVQENGVTFRLTAEIQRELRTAGASTALINTIRSKSPRTQPTPRPNVIPDDEKPNVTYDRIWVQQNIIENGVKGIMVYANFNVYNLKGVPSDIVYRFERDGEVLGTTNATYRSKSGQLVGGRALKPAYSATVYEELAAFIPYQAFNLSPGVHNLKLDADLNLRDGTLVKHLTLQDVQIVIPTSSIPAPSLRKTGSATFNKMWIDYKVQENGVWGMRIHVKLQIRGMKDQNTYLQILFTKADGTKLYSNRPAYQSKAGDRQTAVYRLMRPIYPASNFNDVSVFIPYSEFNLPIGKHDLQIHADVLYSDYSQLQHLHYQPFVFTRSS